MVTHMPTPHASYLICSTPRTGSSLLCDALTLTGVAGRPEEYFQFRARTGFPRRPQEYFEGAGDPEIFDILGPRTRIEEDESRYDPSRYERYENYLTWALDEGTTPNGIFGAKVMWGYFNGFVTGLRWAVPGRQRLSVCELAPSVFPELRYLSVTRRDKVRQAVSLWRALQIVELVERRRRRPGRGRAPRYSAAAIDYLVQRHPGARGRVAGVLPRVRSRALHGRLRGVRPELRGHDPRHPPPRGRARGRDGDDRRSRGCDRSPTGSRAAGPSATWPRRAGSQARKSRRGCGSTRPTRSPCSSSATVPAPACARRS